MSCSLVIWHGLGVGPSRLAVRFWAVGNVAPWRTVATHIGHWSASPRKLKAATGWIVPLQVDAPSCPRARSDLSVPVSLGSLLSRDTYTLQSTNRLLTRGDPASSDSRLTQPARIHVVMASCIFFSTFSICIPRIIPSSLLSVFSRYSWSQKVMFRSGKAYFTSPWLILCGRFCTLFIGAWKWCPTSCTRYRHFSGGRRNHSRKKSWEHRLKAKRHSYMKGFYQLSLEISRWAPKEHVTLRRYVGVPLSRRLTRCSILVGRVVGAQDEVLEDCAERKK